MQLRVQKIKEGPQQGSIKIFDENNGYIVITKEQAKSLADILVAATRS